MQQQIIFIHGGATFDSYNSYLEDMRQRKLSAENFKITTSWRENLSLDLGQNFEVFTPPDAK